MQKAVETTADAVVFDLEDAIAPDEKQSARETVATVLADLETDTEIGVRINQFDTVGFADLRTIVDSAKNLDRIVLPMVESESDLHRLAGALEALGLSMRVTAIIETPQGLLRATEIATAGVDSLCFGAEDLTAQIGATRTTSGEEILYAREQLLIVARAAGVNLVDTVYTKIDDEKGLREDAERVARLGYDGKVVIHPSQIAIVNKAFTPPADRIEWAQNVLEASRNARAAGKSVFGVDGQMIDHPLITRAKRIIELTDAAGEI